jgi:hypothetical protein
VAAPGECPPARPPRLTRSLKGVRPWQRLLLGSALVAVVACAGIAANFALLRLTQDAHDPVGKLSPRSVFAPSTTATVPPGSTLGGSGDDDGHSRSGEDDEHSGSGEDD